MPITLRKVSMKVRDPVSGNFIPVDLFDGNVLEGIDAAKEGAIEEIIETEKTAIKYILPTQQTITGSVIEIYAKAPADLIKLELTLPIDQSIGGDSSINPSPTNIRPIKVYKKIIINKLDDEDNVIQTYIIELDSFGDFCQGVLDLINKKIFITKKYISSLQDAYLPVAGTNAKWFSSGGYYYADFPKVENIKVDTAICSHSMINSNIKSTNTDKGFRIFYPSGKTLPRWLIREDFDGVTNLASFRTWLTDQNNRGTPLQAAYELQQPQIYDFTETVDSTDLTIDFGYNKFTNICQWTSSQLDSQSENLKISYMNTDYAVPQTYGAKGDGETDDTIAMIKCFANNHYIFIPDGTYLVRGCGDDIINIQSNSTIILSKNATIKIIQNPSIDNYSILQAKNKNNIYLFGGNFIGIVNENTVGIKIEQCSNIIIENTNINNCIFNAKNSNDEVLKNNNIKIINCILENTAVGVDGELNIENCNFIDKINIIGSLINGVAKFINCKLVGLKTNSSDANNIDLKLINCVLKSTETDITTATDASRIMSGIYHSLEINNCSFITAHPRGFGEFKSIEKIIIENCSFDFDVIQYNTDGIAFDIASTTKAAILSGNKINYHNCLYASEVGSFVTNCDTLFEGNTIINNSNATYIFRDILNNINMWVFNNILSTAENRFSSNISSTATVAYANNIYSQNIQI